MNKSECLAAYQSELWRQENPYQQWMIKNEQDDLKECEVNQGLLRIIKMEEFTSCFDLHSICEKYLLIVGNNGETAFGAPSEIITYFEKHNGVDIIYADEDQIDPLTMERSYPWFKSDYAPDSLLSNFYFGHIIAIRVDKFKNIPLLRGQSYDITLYDFILKAVEQADTIYHMPKVLFHQIKQNACENVLWATKEFDEIKIEACKRRKMQVFLAYGEGNIKNTCKNARIEPNDKILKHVCYEVKNNPLVSVIIPSKNHFDVLEKCITSFLKYTGYKHVEFIIVDNGSNTEQKDKILQFLKETFDHDKDYNCYYDYEEQPFNFSKMCNQGAQRAQGEYLLFLNDDIEIISSEWLERMLGHAMQPHIGAVGCKLLYPQENRIQHVGITNMGIGPAHKLNGFVDNQIYAHGENVLVLNKIAVTAACLLVSKTKFERAGGFPSDMAVAYNDVALCFSLLKHGYLNVVRNDVTLIHHESLSRGMDDTNEKKKRLLREKKLLYIRYPKWNGRDPYYSKNWVQFRKDTDYTCNYIYEYEDESRLNKITRVTEKTKLPKEKSNNRVVQRLLRQDVLSFSIDSIQGKAPVMQDGKQIFYYDSYDKDETGYLQINGWIISQKRNNECYEYRYLLKNEENIIYECRTYPQLRRDVEDIFSETKAVNIALAGKITRVPEKMITPGTYKIGVVAKSLINQKYTSVTWSEDYLLFFLKK